MEEADVEADRRGDSPVLVMTDGGRGKSKAVFAMMLPAKGVAFDGIEDATDSWVRTLDRMGYKRVTFQSDNGLALVAFLNKVRIAWEGEVVIENSAVGDPQENGAAEAAVGVVKGLTRTLKARLETCLRTQIPDGHPILAWLVGHAAAMHRRYHMGVDGKTAYERLSGRPCAAQVAEFGERIWYISLTRAGIQGNGENMSPGYYLGPVEGRNGACVAIREGILHARTIKRTPWEERWSAEILEVVDAIPMVPPGQHRVVQGSKSGTC